MNIAFFDFDGTITRNDSFLHFIRFVKGEPRFWAGIILHLPLFLLMKLKFVPNWKTKEQLFSYFFKGVDNNRILQLGEEFAEQVIPRLIRPKALAEIKKHQTTKTKIVIVSASFSIWLKPWCNKHGFELLATEHEVKNSLITGKIKGQNCHGIEKAKQIRVKYNLEEYSSVYAYGDSPADVHMLSLASYKWMKWKQI